MTTLTKPSIGLTQFTDFTMKGSAAKTKFVKDIKYQGEYHPIKDYWKALRDGLKKYHEHRFNDTYLLDLVDNALPARQKNYQEAVKAYIKFVKNKNVQWFEPGKANWYCDDLIVRSNPELGLIIDDVPYLIKLYFKGKNERIDKHKCRSALTLLKDSHYAIEHPYSVKHAILNVQKGRLITDDDSTDYHQIALESDAAQFMFIWNRL
ncbi:hypothetical protein QIX46_08800 [Lysinibacillus boronitolerans]|nr:hypothetical protein QIX46_08800 [Lysinibacillus boronitolerans]